MPSKAELREQIGALAGELKVVVNTDGLNHVKLTALVSDLRAKKKDAENVTQADEQAPVADEQAPVADEQAPVADEQAPVADEQAPVADEPKGRVIGEGKALTSKRGMLGPGDKVFESDCGTSEAFVKLQSTGHIVAAGD